MDAAAILDAETGTLHAWGEISSVYSKWERMTMLLPPDAQEDLCLITLLHEQLTIEEICYVLIRLVEYTATPFHKEIINPDRMLDMLPWLRAEIARNPINVYEEDF